MDSGWVINFKDGTAVIMSESKYEEYRQIADDSKVYSEEHWFDIKEAIRENPWLEVLY